MQFEVLKGFLFDDSHVKFDFLHFTGSTADRLGNIYPNIAAVRSDAAHLPERVGKQQTIVELKFPLSHDVANNTNQIGRASCRERV